MKVHERGDATMITVFKKRCVGCSLCVPICPEESISCYGKAEVSDTCTECLSCLEFCPVAAPNEAGGKEECHD